MCALFVNGNINVSQIDQKACFPQYDTFFFIPRPLIEPVSEGSQRQCQRDETKRLFSTICNHVTYFAVAFTHVGRKLQDFWPFRDCSYGGGRRITLTEMEYTSVSLMEEKICFHNI